MFRTIYFHRTVRAIDLTLADLFVASKAELFPGNPLQNLDRYLRFTEWALLVDVSRWLGDPDPRRQALGREWQRLLGREIPWKMVCQRSLIFGEMDAERSSIFSHPDLVAQAIRRALPGTLKDLPLRVDVARHIYRPQTRGPALDQNFLYDSARGKVRPLTDNRLFVQLPVSHRICRVYAQSQEHAGVLAAALDAIVQPGGVDDLTNM